MDTSKQLNYIKIIIALLGTLVFIDVCKYVLSSASLIYCDQPYLNDNGDVSKMLGKILTNWNPSKKYRHKHVTIEFKIDNKGNITYSNIVKSSNIKDLDEHAMLALKKAEPFGHFSGEQADCTFKVDLSTKRYMLWYDFGGIRLIKE